MPCEVCIKWKAKRLPFAKALDSPKEPLTRVHIDLMGPMKPITKGGNRIVFGARCASSGYRWSYLQVNKQPQQIIASLNLWEASILKLCHKTLKGIIVRTDNGTEFCNPTVREWLATRHISHEQTAPYSPEENAIIEKDFPYIKTKALMMLQADNLYDTQR